MRVLIVVASLLTCCFGAARADENADAEARVRKLLTERDAKITPLGWKLGAELADLVISEFAYKTLVDLEVSQLASEWRKSYPTRKQPADLERQILAVVRERATRKDLVERCGKTLARAYNESELGDLKRFYGSQTGKRWAVRSPEILRSVPREHFELVLQNDEARNAVSRIGATQ